MKNLISAKTVELYQHVLIEHFAQTLALTTRIARKYKHISELQVAIDYIFLV